MIYLCILNKNSAVNELAVYLSLNVAIYYIQSLFPHNRQLQINSSNLLFMNNQFLEQLYILQISKIILFIGRIFLLQVVISI